MFFDVFFSFTVLHCFCRGAAEIRCSCWLQAHCFVELQLLVVSNDIPAGASDKACTPQWSQRSPESCGGWTGSPHRKIQQQKPIMALLAPVRCWWCVAQNIHKNDEIIWSCLLLLGLAVRDMRTLCGCQILIQYHDNTFRFIFLACKLQLNVNLEMTPLCQVRVKSLLSVRSMVKITSRKWWQRFWRPLKGAFVLGFWTAGGNRHKAIKNHEAIYIVYMKHRKKVMRVMFVMMF